MLVSWLFPLGKGDSSLFSCCWQGCFWFPMVRISSQSGLVWEHSLFTEGECLRGSCYACFNVMPLRHVAWRAAGAEWDMVRSHPWLFCPGACSGPALTCPGHCAEHRAEAFFQYQCWWPCSPQGDHLCLCRQASHSFPKSRGSFDCVRLC